MAERVKEHSRVDVINLPVPEDTETYKTVSNKDLIKTLDQYLLEIGLIPFKEKYTVAANGQEMYGNWMLTNVDNRGKELFDPGDMVLGINFQNSYDKKLKLVITPGINVCICSNQAMRKTEIASFERKHTGDVNIEFPIFIQNSLERVENLFEVFNEDFNKLKEVKVDRRLMSQMAGQLYIEHNLLTSEQMSLLKKEIEKPTFTQFYDENAFSFYNHVTYSLRNTHPSKVIDTFTEVHEVLTKEFIS